MSKTIELDLIGTIHQTIDKDGITYRFQSNDSPTISGVISKQDNAMSEDTPAMTVKKFMNARMTILISTDEAEYSLNGL